MGDFVDGPLELVDVDSVRCAWVTLAHDGVVFKLFESELGVASYLLGEK